MSKANEEPKLLQDGKLYLTDSGLETVLIYLKGRELRDFASFELVSFDPKKDNAEDIQLLKDYFFEHIAIAAKHDMGFCIETPTWRSSSQWGEKLGYSQEQLHKINQRAVQLFVDWKKEASKKYDMNYKDVIISGCVGPRDDGYVISNLLSVHEYQAYHSGQIKALLEGDADCISGLTMTNSDEAIAIAREGQRRGAAVVISFTVETDTKLPSGELLGEAIEKVDRQTDQYVSYFMINCAHPTHFEDLFSQDKGAQYPLNRVVGVRANASKLSHEELDSCEELDDGNPHELGHDMVNLLNTSSRLRVFGGCCGTDARHIEQIAQSLASSYHKLLKVPN